MTANLLISSFAESPEISDQLFALLLPLDIHGRTAAGEVNRSKPLPDAELLR